MDSSRLGAPAPIHPSRPRRPALSRRAEAVPSSAIRDLLALVRRSEVISLAGGLPPEDLLPAADLRAALDDVLERPDALQYGPTQGEPELRAWIAEHELDGADPDRVVVTHGAQQALQLLVDVLVDPGTDVVVERASYVGMLQPLRAAGARLHDVAGDHDGLATLELSRRLHDGLSPRLAYLAPTYQNPTGSVLSTARRRQVANLANAHRFVVIDDDPYRRLGFDAAAPSRLRADVPDELAVTVGSFSKCVAPGLRVGWLHGPRWLVDAVVRLKQAADLHTSTFGQRAVLALVSRDGWLDEHCDGLRTRLALRAERLVEALHRELGHLVEVEPPAGGMFVWARLDAAVGDTDQLARAALGHGVAIVPGSAFDPSGLPSDGARLCFASVPAEQLDVAATRLADAVREQRRGVVAASMATEGAS
jgi:2-aminoadipate transaminase